MDRKHHKVSPERFRHMAKLLQIATKTQDWHALKRYDSQLAKLLLIHKDYMDDPRLIPEIERARQAHQEALSALEHSVSGLKQQLDLVNNQQERALAYQMAMTTEHYDG